MCSRAKLLIALLLACAAKWSYVTLHNFSGGLDGGVPLGTLAIDSHGNLFGTTSDGGVYGNGVVFQITP